MTGSPAQPRRHNLQPLGFSAQPPKEARAEVEQSFRCLSGGYTRRGTGTEKRPQGTGITAGLPGPPRQGPVTQGPWDPSLGSWEGQPIEDSYKACYYTGEGAGDCEGESDGSGSGRVGRRPVMVEDVEDVEVAVNKWSENRQVELEVTTELPKAFRDFIPHLRFNPTLEQRPDSVAWPSQARTLKQDWLKVGSVLALNIQLTQQQPSNKVDTWSN
ncbi:hypothetical protein EDB89DRAFT_2247963 [Lactarius sanguifluus]|nr:hypothetical protein EDB89DRAFT_2247963 [Lactarius sanguifluus]